MREKLLKIEQICYRIMKWALFSILGAMTLVVLLGVLFRYILESPLPWSEEASRYLMIWCVSLGMAVAFREGLHISVSMVVDRFPEMIGKILMKITQAILLIFMSIVMVAGFKLAFILNAQNSSALEIPMTWPYLAIPVGCLFFIFEGIIIFFFPKSQSPLSKGA